MSLNLLSLFLAIFGGCGLYLLSPCQRWLAHCPMARGIWALALPALVLSLALFMQQMGSAAGFAVWALLLLLVWALAAWLGRCRQAWLPGRAGVAGLRR